MAVFLSRRPDGYFNVLAERGEEVHEALDAVGAGRAAHKAGNVRLLDAEDLPGFGLGDAALLYEAVDLEREARLDLLTLRVGKAEVGEAGVPGT